MKFTTSPHVPVEPRTLPSMVIRQKLIVPLLALILCTASASAGPLVYAVSTNYNNFTGQFGTVDLTTGTFNQIGPVISDPLYGLVPGPNGNLLSVSASGNLDSINPATGAVSVVGAIPVTGEAGNAPYSLAELNGTVYATDLYGNLYTLNTTNGAASLIGPTGIPICPSVYDVSDVSDETLFTANGSLYATFDGVDLANNLAAVDSPALYQINPATGVATPVVPTALGLDAAMQVNGALYGLAFGYYAGSNTVLSLNVANGNTTFLNDYVSSPVAGGLNAFNITGAAPTPEPASFALVGIGIALAFFKTGGGNFQKQTLPVMRTD